MQLKIKGSRWGLKKCTYLQGQKSVVSWLVNIEGDYREFLTRGVWCAGLLPPHSWVQLCFDLYVFSNTVCLLALSSLVCKFHAMSESYSLWDVSFTVDTCSLFSLCCTESQFFPVTKVASLQQEPTDPHMFVFVFPGPLWSSVLVLLGSPVQVRSYFLQWSSCNFLII